MVLTVMVAVPVLLSVTVCAAEVVPSVMLPKAMDVVERLPRGVEAATPVPLSATAETAVLELVVKLKLPV
jgi:hypothetical protein